jgi:hypothetical protein
MLLISSSIQLKSIHPAQALQGVKEFRDER